ncbi:hypothetical protein BCR35DRAFT_293542 [Leucosporidium creatinivorum]|uniref:NFACT RNA-binding domain-containing protein n=1 Tax=Leucosporidium creatinivorum TaxID=106004 RepID=A0A1Y2ERM1_9BASI|nr:hypothetical protein BCR35DRAFT_293542 [Leucosporidium creatinivorum]
MVLEYRSNALGDDKVVTIYAGKDKVSSDEDLLRYAGEDVWVHVDKLSSPHVYIPIRDLPDGMTWESLPDSLLMDVSQLVKAGSIMGNKKNNVTIIYTPSSNLLKTGDMDTGTVSFKNEQKVRRFHVPERQNAIINRLAKTKKERIVDHEAERVERIKEEGRRKRLAANERKNSDLEIQRARKAEAAARSYDNLGQKRGTYSDEDEEWESKQKEGDFDPDEDFM